MVNQIQTALKKYQSFLSDPTNYGEVTSIDLIESGYCPFTVPSKLPTAEPTPTTEAPTYPIDRTEDNTQNDDVLIVGIIGGVSILGIAAAFVCVYLYRKNRNIQMRTKNEYHLMEK
eukprot:582080_1